MYIPTPEIPFMALPEEAFKRQVTLPEGGLASI